MEENLSLFGNYSASGVGLSATCKAAVGLFSNLLETDTLNVTGTATVGNLIVSGTANINNSIFSFLEVTGQLDVNVLNVSGNTTLNELTVLGNGTVSGTFTTKTITTSAITGLTLNATNSSASISLASSGTGSDMITLLGPGSNAFFLRFGQITGQTNPVRLFQSNGSNQGVTGSANGDCGLQFNANTQSFFLVLVLEV